MVRCETLDDRSGGRLIETLSEIMDGMLGEWLVERFGREVEMKIIKVINKWRTDNFKSNF